MDQIHKRFTAEQVKVLLKGYYRGMLDRAAVEKILGIGKTRFFALLKQYRHDPSRLCLGYRVKAGNEDIGRRRYFCAFA